MPSPRTTTPIEDRDSWWWSLPFAVPIASLVAVSSFVQSVNYDEYYWLAVTRKLALGESLYDSMLDNKGPLWYVYPRLVDLVGGRYEVGRAVVLFATAVVLFALCDRILYSLSVPREARIVLASFAVIFAAAASLFYISVELLGIVMVAAAIATAFRHPLLAGGVFLLATLVDPRLALFVPAAVYMSESRAFSWRRALLIGLLPALGVLLYFALPGLRFGVIEFGLATRPTEQVTLRAFLPILIVIWLPALVGMWRLTDRYALRWTAPGVALTAAAVALAGASVAPFTHYWTYLALAFALLAPSAEREVSPSWLPMVLASLSLFPLLVYGFALDVNRRGAQVPYERALSTLGSRLDDTDTVLTLTFVPYPMAAYPVNVDSPAPVSYPYFLETSRQEQYLAEFGEKLPDADAVWIDAPVGLDNPGTREQFAIPLQMIEESGRFTCSSTVGPFVILEPDDAC